MQHKDQRPSDVQQMNLFLRWSITIRPVLKEFLQQVNALPRALLYLSFRMRLLIVLGSFILSVSAFELLLPASLNGNCFVIAIALATWLFRLRGAVLSIIFSMLLELLEFTGLPRIPGPDHRMEVGLIILCSSIIEALIILYLRHTVEVAHFAQAQAQQAKQQMKTSLEEQLQAYEQQLHLIQMKDQFLLNVNHELRTPLTGLYGYLELLKVYGAQLDEETRETFLTRAMEGCEELQRLITHIMDAIQAGTQIQPPLIEEVAVAQVVSTLLEQLEPRKHAEYEIIVEVPETLFVWADPLYLRQILRNLLSNAFKYTPQHSAIFIRAEVRQDARKREDLVCISVQDTGPGIPSRELPLLFGKFVRLQRDVSGSVRGTGLGLYICKQLVDAMDGTIWAESQGIAGEGSRFCFTLPRVGEPVEDL